MAGNGDTDGFSRKAVLRSHELCFLRLFQNEMHVLRLCYVHIEGSADISINTDVSIGLSWLSIIL